MTVEKQTRFDDLPDVLRARDVTQFLGINEETTYNLLRAGKIRNVRVGRSIRIPKWALRAFLDGNGGQGHDDD